MYRFDGRFQGVNLDALSGATVTLARRFAGVAAGELSLVARGRSRDDLIASLEGRGSLEVHRAELRGMDLPGWLKNAGTASATRPVSSAFSTASATFIIDGRVIRIDKMNLVAPLAALDVNGTVDFAQALDLTMRQLPPPMAASRPAPIPSGPAAGNVASRGIRITGTLRTPQVAPLEESPPR